MSTLLEKALGLAVPQTYTGQDNCPWSEGRPCPSANQWTYDPEEETEDDAHCPHENDGNEPCWVAHYLALAAQPEEI